MPYSGPSDPNLPSNVMGMSEEKRKKWVGIFNGVMEHCDKDNEECEHMAFATANDRVKSDKSTGGPVDGQWHDKEGKEMLVPQKCDKCGYAEPFPYTNATSLADAMAEIEIREGMKEMEHHLTMFQQVLSNIVYSPDIKNKKTAIAKASKEFQDMMADEMGEMDKSAIRTSAADGTVKALGGNRIGAYAILWGDENKKDLTGEFFDRHTKDLDVIFKAVGRLPYLYQHGLDGKMKTRVIGTVDVLEYDDTGLWYESQVKAADEYDEQVMRLIREGKLKSSSQTLSSGRAVAKSGHIDRWPIVEISATPTPAEPRMRPVEEVKSAYQEIECDFDSVVKAINEHDEGHVGEQGAEKARLQNWLELERERLELMEIV